MTESMDNAAVDEANAQPSSDELSDPLPKTSKPAERALAAAGYTRLDQFTKISAAEILKLHGVGPKAVRIIRTALAARGQSFADES